jgi:hypothetical protein
MSNSGVINNGGITNSGGVIKVSSIGINTLVWPRIGCWRSSSGVLEDIAGT